MRTIMPVIGLAFALVACNGDEDPAPIDPVEEVFLLQSQEEGLSRAQTEGKRLFDHYCTTCHGELGQGDGQNSYNLDPKPPDFQESLHLHPPSYWREIIQGGSAAVGRSPLCPPWGRNLAVEEIDALVSYLAVLGQTAAPQPPEEAASAVPPDNNQ